MAVDRETEEVFGAKEIEPTTGNEVPPGSLPEEVKDDVPAMLSEGEYVVPADVLRFFGIKFFEDLRRQAKTELAMMDRDGRVGGDPIEEEDVVLPFAVAELRTVDKDEEVAEASRGLYANINARKKAGTSRSKADSTISDEAYAKMKKGFDVGGLVTDEEKKLVSMYQDEESDIVEFIDEEGNISYHRQVPSGDSFVFIPPVPETYRLKAEVDAENSVVTPVEDKEYGGDLDEIGMVPGSSGSKENLDNARNAFIEYNLDPSKKTFLDTIGENLPIGTGLNFLDKTLSGGGTKYSRAVDRLRSDFSKMKEDDPKYQKTKNLVQRVYMKEQADQGNDGSDNVSNVSSAATSGFAADGSVGIGGSGAIGTTDDGMAYSSGAFNQGGLAMKKTKNTKKTYGKGYNKGGAVKGYTTTKKPKYSKGGLASKTKKM